MAPTKVPDHELREFLDSGHTQAQAARHFGVSEPAIYKRLKKLRGLTTRVVALEHAGQVVEQKQLSATARLEHVQRVIDGELAWAVIEARRDGVNRADLADVILKLTAEVRQQLGLQLQITRTLIDLREVRDFRQTVVDVIAQESPEVGRRIVARLKEKRALRQSATLLPPLDDLEGSHDLP
jgi:hypothetical protein